jgi:hypothetical protein
MNRSGCRALKSCLAQIQRFSTVQRKAIKQGRISPMMSVPGHIAQPDYALTGRPREAQG